MASNRHLGRILALQTLYEYGFRKDAGDQSLQVNDILMRNIARYQETVEDRRFIELLVEGVLKHQADLDAVLQPIAPDWPLDQIARMDRSVLQMGLYELLLDSDVPTKVVINEAVELAKAFGGENSSKFINGVLGTVVRRRDDGSLQMPEQLALSATPSKPDTGQKPKIEPKTKKSPKTTTKVGNKA